MSHINDLFKLSQAELSILWGVSTRTIQRLPENESLRHGSGPGCYYVWEECWDQNPRFKAPAVAITEWSDKARKLRAEADMAEMEARQMAGDLLDAKQAKKHWGEFLGRLNASLAGYADRAAPKLEDSMVLAERRDLLRKEMNNTLRDVVLEARKLAANEAGG